MTDGRAVLKAEGNNAQKCVNAAAHYLNGVSRSYWETGLEPYGPCPPHTSGLPSPR